MWCANCDTKITFWMALRQPHMSRRFKCPKYRTKDRVRAPHLTSLFVVFAIVAVALGIASGATIAFFGAVFAIPVCSLLVAFLVLQEAVWYKCVSRKGQLLRLDALGDKAGAKSGEQWGECGGKAKPAAEGVRGWLLVVCVFLTIYIPLGAVVVLLTALRPLRELAASGITHDVVVYLTISSVLASAVTAFSLYAGLQLWRRRAGAVRLARWFLAIYLLEAVAQDLYSAEGI